MRVRIDETRGDDAVPGVERAVGRVACQVADRRDAAAAHADIGAKAGCLAAVDHGTANDEQVVVRGSRVGHRIPFLGWNESVSGNGRPPDGCRWWKAVR